MTSYFDDAWSFILYIITNIYDLLLNRLFLFGVPLLYIMIGFTISSIVLTYIFGNGLYTENNKYNKS